MGEGEGMKIQELQLVTKTTYEWRTVIEAKDRMIRVLMDDGADLKVSDQEGLCISASNGRLFVLPVAANAVKIETEQEGA
jgi:hypothetical protein